MKSLSIAVDSHFHLQFVEFRSDDGAIEHEKQEKWLHTYFFSYRSFMHLVWWCAATAFLALLALAQAQHGNGELTYDPNDPPPFREYQSFNGWFAQLGVPFFFSSLTFY